MKCVTEFFAETTFRGQTKKTVSRATKNEQINTKPTETPWESVKWLLFCVRYFDISFARLFLGAALEKRKTSK